jgi:Cysteine rich repeat
MPRLRFAVLAFTIGFSGSAMAQNLSAEQRDACKADYDKYCSATMPGGGRIIACLNKQYGQLADACKKVIDALKK